MFKYSYQENNFNELVFDKNRYRVKECPCGKSNKDGKFVPYVGFEMEGYCHSCQQIILPKKNNSSNPILYSHSSASSNKYYLNTASYIPDEIFNQSINGYDKNNLVCFFLKLFGEERTTDVIKKYCIGSSSHWQGATVFWQIDIQGNIRSGKIMLYDSFTGKRKKGDKNYTNWMHSVHKLDDFNLCQCLFGEHLLKDITKPVALVESEKTALIASVYLPEFIWLATGGKANLKTDLINVLKGRLVTLFPDSDGYDLWCEKALEFSYITNINVSDLLEKKANEFERLQKFDLADYLIRFNYLDFIGQENIFENTSVVEKFKKVESNLPIEQFDGTIFKVTTATKNEFKTENLIKTESPKKTNWDSEIEELESEFYRINLSEEPIKLNDCTTITNIPSFIDSHLLILKNNNGNPKFIPYLERLQTFKRLYYNIAH